MSGVPTEDLKAYFAQARRWDEDRLARARRSEGIAWAAAAIGAALALAGVGTAAALAPLKSVEPFVIRVDRSTGAVDVMSGLKGDLTPEEAVSKYFVAQYVRLRESWLPASAAEDFAQVAILSSPAEQRRYAERFRSANPESPHALYGPDGVAEAQVRTISFINERVAHVRFRRTARKGGAVTSEDFAAKRPTTPQFAFVPMPEAPGPETLPTPEGLGGSLHFGARAFERRTAKSLPIRPSASSLSTAWVRPRLGPWNKAMLGMLTDSSPPGRSS